MHSFCQGLREKRFDNLQGRDDLWRLLVTITVRKIYRGMRRAKTAKRGGSFAAARHDSSEHDDLLAQIVGREPTPELACMVADDCRNLLEQLGDESLRATAQSKLEGYSHAEIAERLGCSIRSVERKVELIRSIWSQESEHE
jgi:DNA-directed RNA polymerase specialized sigma24 family protein